MRHACLIIAIICTPAFAGVIHAAEFVVKPGAPNQVVFTSKATTETFQGKTDKMEGRITLEPAQLEDTVAVHIEVDLASLDTGIGKRNKDMREDYLETDKYPRAIFDGAVLLDPKTATLEVGKALTFQIEGTFTLHGVTKRLRTSVEILLMDERTLQFKTSFPVPLADYKISRPKFLFLKLGEVQEISVTGTAISK